MEIQSEKIVRICQKVSKISIYLSIFLVPIFFLPFTLDPLDFNKQILLGLLVFIAFFAWLAKIFLSGKVEINSNFLNTPVLIFLLAYLLSTIFSSWRYSSFFGWPLNISQGFLTLFYFFIFYFLVINIFIKKEEIFQLFFIFLVSSFLVILFPIFQIFVKISSFNTIGTLNSLSVFLAISLSLATLLAIISSRPIRWVLAIFATSFLISLILINFQSAWLILIASASIIFIFGLLDLRRTGQTNLVFVSMTLLIISLIFLTFRISLPKIQIPVEISPSQLTELQIAKNSLKNIKNFFFGLGPTAFIFNYSKFKPIEINQTVFWNLRFNSGASEILDKLITTGILGLLSLFFLFGTFFWQGGKHLINLFKENKDWLLNLGIFASFFGLIFGQFLYPVNFSLLFLLWLVLASLSALNPKMRSFSFEFPSLKLAISFTLIFLLAISLSFLLIKNYLAETKYLSGLKAWQRGETEKAINYIEKAINLNPSLDNYQRDISQLYLARLNEVLQKTLASEEMTQETQNLIFNALDSIKRATEISSNNVANWNVRGFVYRNLIGLVGGAEDWAINSYQKALELEPKNPYIFNEIGLVYLAKADLLTRQFGEEKEIAENLTKARDNFQKAIELKSDYAPANFQLAMIYQREGKTKEAIGKLEETKLIASFDSGLAFQLGLLYYNENQMEQARAEFERAIRIDKNYSNARYFLGLIYDKEGKKDLSIEQFEKIEKLNPENLEIKKILANLREGKTALEGILPGQPPIEEKPSERKP